MAKKVKLNFRNEEGKFESVSCDVSEAPNGEIICRSESGHMIKFPEGADVAALVKKHNAANK